MKGDRAVLEGILPLGVRPVRECRRFFEDNIPRRTEGRRFLEEPVGGCKSRLAATGASHQRRAISTVLPAAVRCDMELRQAFCARHVCKTGIGGEVRLCVTSGVSCKTSLNKHVTPHLHRESKDVLTGPEKGNRKRGSNHEIT